MKTVYLSGPIGDLGADTEEERLRLRERQKEFAKYAGKIHRAGYEVLNPFELTKVFKYEPKKPTRIEILRYELHVLSHEADELWLMPGWEESRGCDAEVHVALALGMPVFDMERRRMITLSKTGMQALMRPLCGKIATDVEKMRIYE
jgi:hypothetical protein